MNNEPTTHRKYKRYDEAFKRSAVELWLQGGKSAATIATELGITTQSLKLWKKPLAALPATGLGQQLEEENQRLRREVRHLAQQRDILKKRWASLPHRRHRFECVKVLSHDYPIHILCATLEVSASGYHAWARRAPQPMRPCYHFHEAYRHSRQTYGSPRITHWLRNHGRPVAAVRVARLMRQAGINRRPRRRFRPLSLTDSDHHLPVASNRLLQQAPPVRPDAVWVVDITYVETQEGFLYVVGILDRCSRRCIGWAMGDSLHTALPLAALDMALTQRQPTGDYLLHHSD